MYSSGPLKPEKDSYSAILTGALIGEVSMKPLSRLSQYHLKQLLLRERIDNYGDGYCIIFPSMEKVGDR